MAISKKSYLVVAPEANPGTAVITGGTLRSVPCKSNMKAIKKKEYPQEERGDRNANYTAVDTTRESHTDVKGNWYNDSSALFLLGWFGTDTVTQPNAGSAPTCYSHALTFSDVPKVFTVHKHYDAKAYYSAYSAVEKITLKFSAEGKLMDYDVGLKGLWPTINNSPPAPNFSTLNPFAGYAPIITLSGSATSDIDEFQVEMSQKLKLWYPCNGVQDFTAIYFGERSMKVDFTARFDNDTVYQRFRTGANDSFSFAVAGDNIASTYNNQLTMTMATITYDSMEHDLGKENVLIKAKATVLPTSGALATCTVQNTVSAY
jgi:hypothetical protein